MTHFLGLAQTSAKLPISTNEVMKRIIALINISGSFYIHQLHMEKLLPWRIKTLSHMEQAAVLRTVAVLTLCV